MSTAARRLGAVARGYCSCCLARPARPERARCEVCSARDRQPSRLSLHPIAVPAPTHAALREIARQRGVTLGKAVALVLGEEQTFVWRGVERPHRPLAEHEVRARGQQATSSRQPHEADPPRPGPRPAAKRRTAQARGRQ